LGNRVPHSIIDLVLGPILPLTVWGITKGCLKKLVKVGLVIIHWVSGEEYAIVMLVSTWLPIPWFIVGGIVVECAVAWWRLGRE
jgi:hypothetical protein